MALDTDPTSSAMDSYVSLVDADAYHAAYGHAEWAGKSADARETALRSATQYVDARYRFRSEPDQPQQALAWPRRGYPWPERRVVAATCELAWRALANPLFSDVASSNVLRETIGPMTTVYASATEDGQVRYAVVDHLLRELVVGGLHRRLERV